MSDIACRQCGKIFQACAGAFNGPYCTCPLPAPTITTDSAMADRQLAHQEIDRLQTVYRLAKYPSAQAETLALHYLGMFNYAKQLLWLVDQARYAPETRSPEWEECVSLHVEKIKEAHLKDLGIELKWETSK